MLFAYKYVSHSMEKMQGFIDFIFYEVWCKATGNSVFRLELFNANPELKELMESFYYGDTQGGDLFYGQVERIFGLFTELHVPQINQFKQWYKANNDIEKVCANDPAYVVAHYADIKANHPELSKQLALLFKGLYSQQLLDLAVLRKTIGEIDDHYRAFIEANNTGKCPFCGISDILGFYNTKREAYDHYLPKALYPFNSINFHNLAPACHHCNSSYKTSKDPAFVPNAPAGQSKRRKAFYPYAVGDQVIEIAIELDTSDIDRLTPADIQIKFGPNALGEEIETWRDVYGIDERYKANLCSQSSGKYWYLQVMEEGKEGGLSPSSFLATLERQTQRHPFAESNFLKKAFLEGCQRVGLFEAIAGTEAAPDLCP